MKRNRWGIATAAVGIHICVGSVYAWSVFIKPIIAETGVTLQAVQWTFSLAIFFLGMAAAFFGSFVENSGPTKSGVISAAFFATGLLGTGLAIHLNSLWMMYVFYGVIGGIGLGIGYITPVATLIKWFPNNRGFATGLAIMGFGFAALIAGPAIQYLNTTVGLVNTFLTMGISYCVVMVLSALYLNAPVDGDLQVQTALRKELINNRNKETTDAASTGETTVVATDKKALKKAERATKFANQKQFTAPEAMKTKPFYGLWWMLFINITCGIGLLSVASPMAQEVVGMSPERAAAMVGVIGLVNGAGRLVWASISDYIGRAYTYIAFFLLEIGACMMLAQTTDELLFQFLFLVIISCYGGGFSSLPAYLADLFGTKSLSNIHGKVLTAWAMAGIAGPLVISVLKEQSNGYSSTLYVYAGLLGTALVVSLLLKMRKQ